MKNNNSGQTSTSFVSLLTIVFIALKLCGVITWSWWWVLSPVWIDLGIAFIILVAYLIWGNDD